MLEACTALGRAHRRRVPAARRRRADRLGLPQAACSTPRRSPRPARRRGGSTAGSRSTAGTAPSASRGAPGSTSAASRRAGWPGGRPRSSARRCDDPAVMVDAGGDLVAARGDHIVAVEAAGPVDLRRVDPAEPAGGRARPRAGRAGHRDVRVRPPPVAQRRRPRGAPPDRPGDRSARAGDARDRRERRPGGRRRAGQGARPAPRADRRDRPRRPWSRSTAPSARLRPGSRWCGDDPVGRRPGQRVRRLRLLHACRRLGHRALGPVVEAARRRARVPPLPGLARPRGARDPHHHPDARPLGEGDPVVAGRPRPAPRRRRGRRRALARDRAAAVVPAQAGAVDVPARVALAALLRLRHVGLRARPRRHAAAPTRARRGASRCTPAPRRSSPAPPGTGGWSGRSPRRAAPRPRLRHAGRSRSRSPSPKGAIDDGARSGHRGRKRRRRVRVRARAWPPRACP